MVSGLPIKLPWGEELMASAPTSGDLDGRRLLAALLVASTRSWFRRRANHEYARAGRYIHFVVARKR